MSDQTTPALEDARSRHARRTAQAQQNARLILAGVLILMGLWTLHDFLTALGWAVILAVATWPLYVRFTTALPKKRDRFAAPLLFTLLIGLVFLGPFAMAAVEAGRELSGLMIWLDKAQRSGVPMPDWLSAVPWMGPQAAEWWQYHLATPGSLSALLYQTDTATLAHLTQQIGVIVAQRATFFIFTLLALFFLFRDGVAIARQFRVLSNRVLGRPGPHLCDLLVSAVRSTADGLVLVGLGEGAVLAVAYILAGVPHPILFGALTGLLAMIPFGAPVVFGAASVLLLLQDNVGGAIGVLVVGFIVLFVADHFIRPVMIGGAAKLPFLWVLLGIFGGLATFGVLGIFLGPALMAALVSLWREWTEPRKTARPAGT